MDIETIVSQLKERGDVIRQPRRLRRKPKKRIVGEEARVRRAEAEKRAQARRSRWWKSVSGTYYHLRKTYRSRAKARAAKGGKPVEFLLSLEDYKRLWEAAGFVRRADGTAMPIWCLRGRRKGDARMWRIDENKPWQLDNVIVLYQGQIRANGRKLVQQG